MSNGLSEWFVRSTQHKKGTITTEWLNTDNGTSYSTTTIQFNGSSPLKEELTIRDDYSKWYDGALASRSTNTPNSGSCAS
jgi:hypothetical protein